MILAPIPVGELIDKITILEIKCKKFSDEQYINCKKELELLMNIMIDNQILINDDLMSQLRFSNKTLWDIEDKIREKERLSSFDDSFIKLARSVYIENDKRSKIKRLINLECNSELIEEKSYEEY